MERNFPFYIDPLSLSNLMDTNGTATPPAGLSYYPQHQQAPPPPPPQHQTPTAVSSAPSPNGSAADRGSLPVQPYPVGAAGVAAAGGAASEPVRRKRGRPRKYPVGEPGGGLPQAVPSPSALAIPSSSPKKRDRFFDGGSSSAVSSKKSSSQLVGLGNVGQSFTPHIINVSAGEDIAQKIMLFMQQCKRDLCILSASGSITNASLRQPATSGGNITIEGQFDILSLSGSYVRTAHGGKTGGLSVSLSSVDGQIIGGGVGGPLKAAGPVQVIVGTFLMDAKKAVGAGIKGDPSLSMLASPIGGPSASNAGFQPMETYERISIRGSDDHQNVSGNHLMIQPQAMQMMHSPPTGWNARNSVYEPTGRADHVAQQSPENGDYDQIPD